MPIQWLGRGGTPLALCIVDADGSWRQPRRHVLGPVLLRSTELKMALTIPPPSLGKADGRWNGQQTRPLSTVLGNERPQQGTPGSPGVEKAAVKPHPDRHAPCGAAGNARQRTRPIVCEKPLRKPMRVSGVRDLSSESLRATDSVLAQDLVAAPTPGDVCAFCNRVSREG